MWAPYVHIFCHSTFTQFVFVSIHLYTRSLSHLFHFKRAKTSRQAVKLMGELSEFWGYADAAESLIVIDPQV